MSERKGWNTDGKRATFSRLVIGSEEHEAMMRYAEECYIAAFQTAFEIARTVSPTDTPIQFATCQTLLDKIASPLIYIEMDWHKLPIRDKAHYARGKYAEAIANKIKQMSPQNPSAKEGFAV